MNRCELIVSQQMLKQQSGFNCGVHLLMNLELLLSNEDPGEMSFNDDVVKNIRRYHFMIRHTDWDQFRLKLM